MTARCILAQALLALTTLSPAVATQLNLQQKSPAVTPKQDFPVIDINKAGVDDFEHLPGIGPTLAHEIVNYREKHGPYRRVEDLLAVPRIGYTKWSGMRPYLKVESTAGQKEGKNGASKTESKKP